MNKAGTRSICLGFTLFTVGLAAFTVFGAEAAPMPGALRPAVATGDVDLDHCATLADGKPVPTDPSCVAASLGLIEDPRLEWSGGEVQPNSGSHTFDYLVTFSKPRKIGSLLCDKMPADGEVSDRVVYALRNDARFPPDPGDRKQWDALEFPAGQSGGRLITFAPSFTTRALLTREIRRQGRSVAGMIRPLASRLHNLTPGANATAPSEYTVRSALAPAYTLSAENIVTGAGIWQSNGKEDGVVRGSAITPGNPCWFVVQWDQPQTLSGLWIDDNFVKVRFLSYVGPDGINPVIGNEDEWLRIKGEERVIARSGRRDRFVSFSAPIQTRAIKIEIIETPPGEVQVARIAGLHLFQDLEQKPAPRVRAVEAPPPFKVDYDLPRDGMTTLAIEGADGHRVRNLVAREQRRQGPNEEPWDLKDEQGRPVTPGKYTLKILSNPGIHLRYQMTPYPNIEMNAPENSPWLNGESGSGGWLADHTSCSSVCAAGDRLYVGATVSESGVSLIECDLNGHKRWGRGNFLAWTGPHLLSADKEFVYAAIAARPPEHGDLVYRIRMRDKRTDRPIDLAGSGQRKRGVVGLASRDGKIYLAINNHEDVFANAADAADVDLDHCFPSYPKVDRSAHNTQATWIPDRRQEFAGLFRMSDEIPGHRRLIWIESQKVAAARQHVVLAFQKAVPVGSFVFPQNRAIPMRISLLKTTVAGHADPSDESLWETIWQSPKSGDWTVVPAPQGALTRAVRLTFAKVFDEIEDALSSGDQKQKEVDPADLLYTKTEADLQDAWKGEIEGMKILRRRFSSLLPSARISVSSGKIDDDGKWDARRAEPLTEQNPAIYVMQWDAPRKIRGLAIKEIDGRLTHIDVWDGPPGAPIEIADKNNWKTIAAYEQRRRKFGEVEANLGPNNSSARYLDGYVDFGDDISTRAVRLRVVDQWGNNGVGNETRLGARDDLGGQTLSASRCHIDGVAPLEMIGGEAPVDPLIGQRIEVWDTQGVEPPDEKSLASGKAPESSKGRLVKELPFPNGSGISITPRGAIVGISGRQIVEIDPATGELHPIINDVVLPQAIAVDDGASIYVLDNDPARKTIRVYDPSGKFLREIGKRGGYVTGAWDSHRIDYATSIAIDGAGQLWHTESSYWPKRLVCWDARDGSVKKEFLGNTQYGGGGVLDPKDKSRLYYGPLEFAIDWETGKSRLKNLTWRGSSTAGEVPAYVNGRQYMLTHANGATQPDNGVGTVYLYNDGMLRPVAAMGPAADYVPLQTPEFRSAYARKFPNQAIASQRFLWCDLNGDGQIQIDEVQFAPKVGAFRTCYFDTSDLSLTTTGRFRYQVSRFLPSGVPVYVESPRPQLPDQPSYRLTDASEIFMMMSDEQVWRNALFTQEGREIWGYRNEGFSGFAYPRATPWAPWKVVAEFDIIGSGRSRGGDLGEFFVTNDNVGQWNVYTSDGLLAGWIFLEIRNPQRKGWSMPEHQRGLALDDVTVGQEHFQGYFCQTSDGKYYVVAGHNHASIVEVVGLDGFIRRQKTIDVTAADLQGLQQYDHERYKRLAYRSVKVLDVYPAAQPLHIDGSPDDWKDQPGGAQFAGLNFKMTFDDRYLYLLYQSRGHGPLKNTGNDWKTLFRTGACVDLQMSTDPKADPLRQEPARGDVRLLISMMGDRPVAVLYDPVHPGADEGESKEFHTAVARTPFDRVIRLQDAVMAEKVASDGEYVLEAAVPLSSLGLKISDGMRVKLDWGILESGPGGSEVLDHLWWSNKTPLPFDEAAEARLHPDLWGYARFSTKPRTEREGPRHATGTQILDSPGDHAHAKRPDEIEDELEKGAVK